MKARPLSALLAGAVAVAALALLHAVPAVADSKPTNSAKLAEPLKKAQEDVTNKRYAEAITKLKDAESIAGKTPYDQHLINEMLTFSYIKTQNYTEAAKTMEAEIDDGFVPAADMNQKVKALAELNYQIKNYDKAIDFGNRAIKGGFADESMKTLVGQSYYLKGDWRGTLKYEEGIVDGEIKAGEKPTNESLRIIFSSCQKVNDDACQMRTMEKLVTYYPSPENWGNLLFTLRKDTSSNEADLLQTYRLMSEVDVLKDPTDYSEMAELALDNGSPGGAQPTPGVCSPTSASRTAASACWTVPRSARPPTRRTCRSWKGRRIPPRPATRTSPSAQPIWATGSMRRRWISSPRA